MKVLKFKVSGQSLVPVDIPEDIAPGTRGYLRCEFDVSGESAWTGCSLIAEFNGDEAVMVRNGRCNIPDSIASRTIFKVKLYGLRGKRYRIVTNDVVVKL